MGGEESTRTEKATYNDSTPCDEDWDDRIVLTELEEEREIRREGERGGGRYLDRRGFE